MSKRQSFSEEEIIYKIKQALDLTRGQLTEAMLERHLTSRVDAATRRAVLKKLETENFITITTKNINSLRGFRSVVKIITRQET